MPIQKDYETPSTGATATYHVIQQLTLDYVSSLTNATIASYLTKDAKTAGKFPMQTQQYQIDGLPAADADPQAFAESKLIEAAPADAVVPPYANRYALAGGTIVE